MSKGVVLMYHRVASPLSDPFDICVSKEHFEEHMKVLQQYGTCMSLQDLSSSIKEGRKIENAIAVTFDDGTFDLLKTAKPIMERYNISGTLFSISGSVKKQDEYFWNALARIFLFPGLLPPKLDIIIDGESIKGDIREWQNYSNENAKQYKHWKCGQSAPTIRHSPYQMIWECLMKKTQAIQMDTIDQLNQWAKDAPKPDAESFSLSIDQLKSLTEHDVFEIGAHTVEHTALDTLPPERQREEIEESKNGLEEMLGRSITGFSYPFGCYQKDTPNIVKDAQYDYACICGEKLVLKETSPYRIPRFMVMDWDGKMFDQKLQDWLFAVE